MKRKRSLRDAYADKMRAKGEASALKRSTLARVSRKQKTRLRDYSDVRRAFLQRNEVCAICKHTNPLHPNKSTEVHHKFGRAGSLIADVRGFIPSCRFHRDWPHVNPEEARKLGLLGHPAHWNVPIDEHRKIN